MKKEVFKEKKSIVIARHEEDFARMDKIKNDLEKKPDTFIQEKIQKLDFFINQLPDSKPIEKGNITMKQYLISLKQECQNNPEKIIKEELEKVKKAKKSEEEDLVDELKVLEEKRIIEENLGV